MGNELFKIKVHSDNLVWDSFVAKTRQNSIFSSSQWLLTVGAAMGIKLVFLNCYSAEQAVAGLPLFVERKIEGLTVRPALLTPYSGLHVVNRDASLKYRNESRDNSLIGSILKHLSKHYAQITLVNHPSIVDVRQLQWYGWETKVRYTYLISNIKSQGNSQVSADVRRRAMRAQEAGVYISPSVDFDSFYKLWVLTFSNQRDSIPLDKNDFMKMVLSLSKLGIIRMWAAFDKSGVMLSAAIFVFDKQIAYYWLAANNRAGYQTGSNQLLMMSIIDEIKQLCECVDFMGADMPRIAYYKSTFGGSLVTHYENRISTNAWAKLVRFLKGNMGRILRETNG